MTNNYSTCDVSSTVSSETYSTELYVNDNSLIEELIIFSLTQHVQVLFRSQLFPYVKSNRDNSRCW